MAKHRFKLYYWPLPFRGCFVSYLFAYRDYPLKLGSTEELIKIKGKDPEDQPIPFVGPPVLHDRDTDIYLSQMPAIVPYVSRELGLMPKAPLKQARAMKVLMDCNDVLMEICNYNGSKMWTRDEWSQFRGSRLPRWMRIFEESVERGFIGKKKAHFGDIGTFALFGNMTRSLPQLESDLKEHAPRIHALCEKIGTHPPLKRYRNKEAKKYGDLYCGGQIEKSIREMLAG